MIKRERERFDRVWVKWKIKNKRERGLRERRTETVLPAQGLSALRTVEQWQETSAWNFSPRAGMRAPYPGTRGPAPPCGQERRHSLEGLVRGLEDKELGVGTLNYIQYTLSGCQFSNKSCLNIIIIITLKQPAWLTYCKRLSTKAVFWGYFDPLFCEAASQTLF